jgi:hypothetical protein
MFKGRRQPGDGFFKIHFTGLDETIAGGGAGEKH